MFKLVSKFSEYNESRLRDLGFEPVIETTNPNDIEIDEISLGQENNLLVLYLDKLPQSNELDIFNFTIKDIDSSWETKWMDYLKPIKISTNILVIPIFDNNVQKDYKEKIVIKIHPSMAFGTGSHATTIGSMQALEKTVFPDSSVWDIGCGSGILGILAKKLGSGDVVCSDIDNKAVENTIENASLNNISIDILQADLLDGLHNKVPDITVANILKPFILQLIPKVSSKILIVSGILVKQQEAIINCLSKNNYTVKEEIVIDGWVTTIAILKK